MLINLQKHIEIMANPFPLDVLRDFVSTRKQIIEDGVKYIFDQVTFYKTATTNFMISGTTREDGEKVYYTLQSLKYFLDHKDLEHEEYSQKVAAAGNKLQIVHENDRAAILAYLFGQIMECANVDLNGPVVLPMRSAKRKIESTYTVNHTVHKADPRINCRLLSDVTRVDIPMNVSIEPCSITDCAEGPAINSDSKKQVETWRLIPIQLWNRTRIPECKLRRPFKVKTTNRNAILQTDSPDCLSIAAQILENIVDKLDKNSQEEKLPTSPVSSEYSVTPPSPSYSRYNQKPHDDFIDDEFKIDPMMSFKGTFSKIVTNKHPSTSNGLSRALEMVMGSPQALKLRMSPEKPIQPVKRMILPIIIVPEMPPSLITMLNAKDILEDLHFVSHDDKRSLKVKRKNYEMIIHHRRGGENIPYRVVDLPEKLSTDDWEQVVAVFVTGRAWQFKKWPWNGNPVEICSKLSAHHLKFDHSQLDVNVKQWPVNVIEVKRDFRHLDKAAFTHFWLAVEQHIRKKKPWLRC